MFFVGNISLTAVVGGIDTVGCVVTVVVGVGLRKLWAPGHCVILLYIYIHIVFEYKDTNMFFK